MQKVHNICGKDCTLVTQAQCNLLVGKSQEKQGWREGRKRERKERVARTIAADIQNPMLRISIGGNDGIDGGSGGGELGVQQCFGVVYHELTTLRQVYFARAALAVRAK